jgi:hypothetical protein
LAFQTPGQSLKLPATTPKAVKVALEEARFRLDNGKLLSTGDMIKTTVDRLLTAEKIVAPNTVSGISQLPIDQELTDDLKDLNIIDKTTLHVEDYKTHELANATNMMVEVLDDIYGRRERRAALKK